MTNTIHAKQPHGQAPHSDAELLARLDERLPRYTSYPTAPHFTAQIGAVAYASWLGALPAQAPLSLYLHVPFCESLCNYCGCHTTVAYRPDRIAHYAQLLVREVDLVAEAIGRRQRVTHIHWGGGTPSALAPDDFVAVARRIGERFHIDANAEIAVEIDPRHFERDHVEAFAEAGVNRASLGVQDLDPVVQAAIGRIQTFGQTARAVEALRRTGVDRISFDLMYGLPYQTELSVAASAKTALVLQPARLCLFGYAHVPWMKKHQQLIPFDALPGLAERLRQVRAAEAALAGAGYVPIGLDHFAVPDDPLALAQSAGRLHRNFQGYTTDEAPALIGLGASSIGSLPQGYIQNSPDLKLYRETVERGGFATARGFQLADDDRLRRTIIERLMCDLTVDLAHVTPHATALFARELEQLAAFSEDGLVVVDATKLIIPGAMRPFVRKIAAVFDTYLRRSAMRHSHAI